MWSFEDHEDQVVCRVLGFRIVIRIAGSRTLKIIVDVASLNPELPE